MNKTPTQKRHQFSKDLDKMMSGHYVLVPITPTSEMLERANQVFNGTTHGTDHETLIKYLWNTMLGQAMNEHRSEHEM